MLADCIHQALSAAFPEVPFVFDRPPNAVASLTGPCAELSPLQIFDDGHEATIYLGTITHGHLGCFEDGLSMAEEEREIAADVVDFTRDLLSDRVVVTSALGGRIAGWRRLAVDAKKPRRRLFVKRYVWSRPLQWAR